MRRAVLALALTLPSVATAQDAATLADLRQDLAGLYVELQRLQRELSTTGAAGTQIGGQTTLERIDAIEAALAQQTARAEALEARIQRVVENGTNRIGDLEFRICELEPGCDIGEIGSTLPLGGETGEAVAPRPAPRASRAIEPEMAVGEQADFARAKAAHDAGNWAEAAELFSNFTQTYPGGPLSGEAHFLRGQALQQQGEDSEAARAYLDSFSGSPQGERAPQALLQLGLALGRLGQREEACVTLNEVTVRYPDQSVANEAQGAAANLGCG
jgi:tol-pal system protein YbgF